MDPQKRRSENALNAVSDAWFSYELSQRSKGKLTGKVADENLACGHLGEIAQVGRGVGVSLCRKEDGAGVDEDPAVFLVEVFDRAGVRVYLDGTGHRAGEFLVGEGNLCDLGLEGAGDEGPEEIAVEGVAVPGICPVGVVYWEDTGVLEGGDELGAVRGDVAKGLVGEEIGTAP